ncbi:unnamed protein product [Fraxinus pennsylvanica]|uniref:MSP domain-containing protein n=1 Tax=Fraxinus pennsylvanica TaxID=56036 RepID=A0AAD2DNI4_9LAMI|nr:unnamed protein product [Fraxinus pennsylvanica]
MQLTHKTDQYIAFKVKTTSPKRYCVQPNAGVVLPKSVCNVTVTMQAHKEVPADMQCKDKFLIQGVVALRGTTNKDLTAEMFHRTEDKIVNEAEGDEEGSPRTSSVEDDNRTSSLPEAGNEDGSTLDLQDFLLRGRVLKLYRQALRIARRALNGSSGEASI